MRNRINTKQLFCLLLTLLGLALPQIGSRTQAAGQESAAASESWYGVLSTGNRDFRFFIELQHAEGEWSGVLQSLDEGGRTFKLDGVSRNDEVMEFQIKVSAASFSGKLDKGKTVVDGKWNQRAASIALRLEKVEKLPEEKLHANWTGTINVLIQKLEVQVRELENGNVYFDSLTQGVGGFVATKSVDGQKITFEVPGVQGKFEGKLREDGEQIVGTWKQSFVSPELILVKSKQAAVATKTEAPKRPQMPKGPFPYSISEVTFENAQAKVTLAGTLTIPGGDSEKFPVVVMVSGSGPQDRDETLLGHKPFWVIADYFSRNGIAVLRYDDRGVGESKGTFETATSVDFAADAMAALEFLSKHPKIDAKKMGICGHSEGSYVASMVAARRPDVAFIVLMAGPGVTGAEILTSQMRLILEASGLAKELIESQCNTQRVLIDLAMKVPKLSDAEYASQAKKEVEKYLSKEEISQNVAEQVVQAAAAQLRSPWMEYFVQYDPASDLQKVACPVLALIGSKDLQVDPKLNLPAIEQALTKAPTKDFQVLEIPKLNHLFQNCETGLMQEYAEIEETFDAATLTLMKDWILKHAK